jgi:hypothetical protein
MKTSALISAVAAAVMAATACGQSSSSKPLFVAADLRLRGAR